MPQTRPRRPFECHCPRQTRSKGVRVPLSAVVAKIRPSRGRPILMVTVVDLVFRLSLSYANPHRSLVPRYELSSSIIHIHIS